MASEGSNDSKRQALDYLLGQSSIYAQIIGDKLERERNARADSENKQVKKEQKAAAAPAKPEHEAAPARSSARTRKGQPARAQSAKSEKKSAPADSKAKRKRDENQLADVMSKEVSSPSTFSENGQS